MIALGVRPFAPLDAPWTPTEVEAHRLAWARIRAVCLLVVWIARVTS